MYKKAPKKPIKTFVLLPPLQIKNSKNVATRLDAYRPDTKKFAHSSYTTPEKTAEYYFRESDAKALALDKWKYIVT